MLHLLNDLSLTPVAIVALLGLPRDERNGEESEQAAEENDKKVKQMHLWLATERNLNAYGSAKVVDMHDKH